MNVHVKGSEIKASFNHFAETSVVIPGMSKFQMVSAAAWGAPLVIFSMFANWWFISV